MIAQNRHARQAHPSVPSKNPKKPRGHPRGFFMPKTFSHRFSFSRPRSILPVSFAPRPAPILFPFRHSSHPRISTPPKLPVIALHKTPFQTPKALGHCSPLSFFLFPATRPPSPKVHARPLHLFLRPTPPPTPSAPRLTPFYQQHRSAMFFRSPHPFARALQLAHPFAPRLVACPLRPVLPATPLIPLSCSISTFRNFRPLTPPDPLVLVSFFHTLILPFFCGRKGRLRRAAFPRGVLFLSPTFFAPFRIRSIGPCARFYFVRLAHALVSYPVDWSMRSFRVRSIGQRARFAFARLVHARSPVGGDLSASVRCRSCGGPRCMIE